MSIPFLGEGFALGAAFCWAVGPLIAYRGVDALGTFRFSMYRFSISAVALFAMAMVFGQLDFSDPRTLIFLCLSGIVGVAFGEATLFQSVFLLGPRRSSLIFTLHAPLTAILGSLIFREDVSPLAMLGVALAFGGVYIAVIFRSGTETDGGKFYKSGVLVKGLILIAVAIVCQVSGALLAKEVIHNVDPLFASFVRTCAAAVAFVPVFLVFKESKNGTGLGGMNFVVLSAVVSTIGGMTFLLAAFANTEIFRAVILSSLSPVFYILIMSVFARESFHWAAWVGTCVAVLGATLTVLSALQAF